MTARRSFSIGLVTAAVLLGAPAVGQKPPGPPALAWKSTTTSPLPTRPPDAKVAPLLSACGAPDGALMDVATRNVQRQLSGQGLLPSDELAFTVRASGDPHVWPRAWSITGQALDDADLLRRVKTWSGNWNALGTRRCGVARGMGPDGTQVVSAVAVDALADLSPLPTTARVGQWIQLEATMLVPATAAKVVLLGPRGAPRSVVASLSKGKLRSTFSVDQPGPWVVQVLATVSVGPRPVLEAMVFAGTAPPTTFSRIAAPGEDAGRGAKNDDDALVQMVNAARATEQLPPLKRDSDLDRLALAHSEEMRRAKLVAHDVGGGDPRARIEASGVRARLAGENVASASTLEGAHRALWASPSHRGNVLSDRFTRLGVSVLRGADGFVWVTQLFAN
jgi:uncharacterized protein YkwD